MALRSICVFCGADSGRRPVYARAATEVGRALAMRGIRLVFGGGRIGLMGAVADAAIEAGGETIGVIPNRLMDWELGHGGLTELRVVASMHERKALMADLADGFIALPGGYGTFEEFCEVLTWAKLGLHPKPCGLLNVDGFYDPLLALFDHAEAEGFVRPEHRGLVCVSEAIDALLAKMERFQPLDVEEWRSELARTGRRASVAADIATKDPD